MKLRVAIIGTGNIGTDLLLKLKNVEGVEVVGFIGRSSTSKTLDIAREKNVRVSCESIDFFIKNQKFCDVVYDCTNSDDAIKHSEVFAQQEIKVIDLTPAKVGPFYVPGINSDLIKTSKNVNMITCGGQASIPLLHTISRLCKGVEYIEVVSQIASSSAGMATRINIDSYIETTRKAITEYTGCKNCKVILNLNPAIPQVCMQTTLFVKACTIEKDIILEHVTERVESIKKYIPKYELVLPPTVNDDGILMSCVKVKGAGDYLPAYAGNLDIINCAAIEAMKDILR